MNLFDLLEKTEAGFKPKITERGFCGLLAGPQGSGKTTAMLSFAEIGPLYVFDCDNRIRGGLASLEWQNKEVLQNIDFDFYNPSDGYKAIDDKQSLLLAQVKNRSLKYKTICVEGTSSIQRVLMLDSRRLRGSAGKTLGNLKFADPQDYNYASQAMAQIMYNFVYPMVEMGVNIIFSGHIVDRWGKQGTPLDEDGKPKNASVSATENYSGSVVIGEKLLGTEKIAEEIPGYFDEIYRFSKTDFGAGVKYEVKFSGDFAKTSLPIAGKTLDLSKKSFYSQWKNLTKDVVY